MMAAENKEPRDVKSQKVSQHLVKLADAFRLEGDITTADALVRQAQSCANKRISAEDRDWVRRVSNYATSANNEGNFADAEPSFVEALRVVEAALGGDHPDIADYLNGVALCRFNNCDYASALKDYSRLLRLMETVYGSDDELTRTTRDNVEKCKRCLRMAAAGRRLQTYVDAMTQQRRVARSVELANQAKRTRALAKRASAHGRRLTAVRLHEHWLELRLREVHPDDEGACHDRRQYAHDLLQAGEGAKAVSVLVELVVTRNRQAVWSDDRARLQAALSDLANGLAAVGAQRSAKETVDLAHGAAKRRHEDEDGNAGV